MDDGVGQEFANHDFIVVWQGLTKHAVWNFDVFLPVGNLLPDRFDEFLRIQDSIRPGSFRYFLLSCVIFDELDVAGG